MISALEAMVFGVRAVGRAPTVILGTYLTLLAAVLPAAAAVERTLAAAVDDRQLEAALPGQANDAWFADAASATRAVAGDSLSPAIVGFAVPLSNLEDLVNGEARSYASMATVAVWMVVWTLALGGLLHRFANGAPVGTRAFLRASFRYAVPFAALAAAVLVTYATAAFLFAAASGSSIRLPVLALCSLVVGAVSVFASYARARIVIANSALLQAVVHTARLVRAAPQACLWHVFAALSAWAALMAAFAAADLTVLHGGGLWQPVILAQLYIVGRIVLRLIWEASTLKLMASPRG